MKVLAGDVGGTKTLLAVAEVDGPLVQLADEKLYPSQDYSSLTAVARDFLSTRTAGVAPACFAVAGPVVKGTSRVTKLPWVIEEGELQTDLRLPRVRLMNDFAAVATGIEALADDDLEELTPGRRDPRGPVAVLGAGTGLGEAFVVQAGDRRLVVPSEGGHGDFAPRNELEIDLLRFMIGKYRRVSYDRVVCGPGLKDIYTFLRDSGKAPESDELRAAISVAGEAPPVITRFADERRDPLCEATLQLFVSIYGAEAGNLALKVVATGGVFLAGGITPRILHRLKGGAFRDAYVTKGRLSPLVESIPVYAIKNPKVGLLGAALEASRLE
jgi:glucokinase